MNEADPKLIRYGNLILELTAGEEVAGAMYSLDSEDILTKLYVIGVKRKRGKYCVRLQVVAPISTNILRGEVAKKQGKLEGLEERIKGKLSQNGH